MDSRRLMTSANLLMTCLGFAASDRWLPCPDRMRNLCRPSFDSLKNQGSFDFKRKPSTTPHSVQALEERDEFVLSGTAHALRTCKAVECPCFLRGSVEFAQASAGSPRIS